MHYEVALIPALAGYWFINNIYLFKDPFEGKSNQQVIFESALVGGNLLVTAWILVWLLEDNFESGGPLQYVDILWRNDETPEYATVLIVTVLIAIVCPFIINLIVSKKRADIRWALLKETARGRILRDSYEKSILSEVLMDNGQSYIGFPEADPITLSYEGDVTFVPTYYGHRDHRTNQLTITSECSQNDDEERVVLQLDKIMAVSLFFPENNDIIWYA